jgi:hypothetical protein
MQHKYEQHPVSNANNLMFQVAQKQQYRHILEAMAIATVALS